MIMRKLILICALFYFTNHIIAQDTVIFRQNAFVRNDRFISMMDSVVNHANECVFVHENSFCIFVEKYNYIDTDYYRFITEPLNISELWMYETIYPRKVLYPYRHKSCLFIFSFTDDIIGISSSIDTLYFNKSDWLKYLYIRDEDNPEMMLPIRAIEIYEAATLNLYRRIPCIDVSSKKRIINTIHTKLFL